MENIELLRMQAEATFNELLQIIEGIDEPLSWAVIPLKEGEYFHHNASILGIVQHLAECRLGYASAGFHNLELRIRDITAKLDEVGSSWEKTKAFLHESHEYWMSSLADLRDERLMDIRNRIQGDTMPLWKILTIMITHDAYHAGQIEVLKSSLSPTNVPPPSMGDLSREWASDLPTW